MASPDPDWTPLAYIVGGGAIMGIMRWLAIRLLMISPTHAAQKKLQADLKADLKGITDALALNHDAIATVASHQEGQDAKLAFLEKFLPGPEGR